MPLRILRLLLGGNPLSRSGRGGVSGNIVQAAHANQPSLPHCYLICTQLADAEAAGVIEVPGVEVTVKRIPETLPEEVLSKMHAAPKEGDELTAAELAEYDGASRSPLRPH